MIAATGTYGGNPYAIGVDQATHTAYVGNGADATVSVIAQARTSSPPTNPRTTPEGAPPLLPSIANIAQSKERRNQ